MKLEFSRQSFEKKNTQISNFIKIRPLGAAFFHANGRTDGRTDRQTEMTNMIVDFRNFANAPKIENSL